MFGILMAFGLVSMSFGLHPYFIEKIDEQIQYVKEVVAELDDLKKKGKLHHRGKALLVEGKDFLEFAEKVKKSSSEDCKYAVRDVMSDDDNRDKYHYFIWSESEGNMGCMPLRPFAENVRKFRKGLYHEMTNYSVIIK